VRETFFEKINQYKESTKKLLEVTRNAFFEGIKYAKSIGAEIYDFRGVPGVLEDEKDHPE